MSLNSLTHSLERRVLTKSLISLVMSRFILIKEQRLCSQTTNTHAQPSDHNHAPRMQPALLAPPPLLPRQEAYRQGNGLYPRSLLGLAALDVSGKGDTVTAESILQTLQGDIASPARGTVVSGDASRRLRATSSNAVAAREGGGGGGVSDESMTSFGNVARRNLGLS